MSYKTKNNCQSPWFGKKPGLGRLALTRSQGRKGVGPGLGYGLSSNVPYVVMIMPLDMGPVRHYCRANPDIADN